MSDLRSTIGRFWNSPNTRNGVLALTIAGTTLGVACSEDGITAPPSSRAAAVAAPTALSADKGTSAPKVEPPKVNSLSQDELEFLKHDYEAYKKAVKTGNIVASVLRCEPGPQMSQTKVIGRNGGRIHVGHHMLQVPVGALDSDVAITATAPASNSGELDFAPHGLTFHKPVEVTISYEKCILPLAGVLGVSYLDGGKIVQQMPSHDHKSLTKMTALTDHFSGYAVSWGRE